MAKTQTDTGFVAENVLKRDAFSETLLGHLADDPDHKVALRKLDGTQVWVRPIAWFLARREVRAIHAVDGITGVPKVIKVDDVGILRSWVEGTPLQLAKPDDAAWYRDAKRLLRDMRRAGVTHNDVAKPQNWLRTPDGRAAVIDFQLASVHRRRGRLFRLMAREDLRHLLKQKRKYAPHLLTASERSMLNRKSLPTRIWMATGKRIYLFVTRRLMNWSDGEGDEGRMVTDGASAMQALKAHDAVNEVALHTYPLPAKGVGLYAFVETNLSAEALRALVPASQVELVQPVAILPRHADGSLHDDLLQLVASNRIDELGLALQNDDALAHALAPVIANRLNLTDRTR